MKHIEINFLDISENDIYTNMAERVIEECFKTENMEDTKLYVNVVFTNPKNIKETNKKYRGIDKETDVLSFPMFSKEELTSKNFQNEDILGDIVISVEKVLEQAKEYGNSVERELSYMIVHGFYHLMGYDHIEEHDKKEMRQKEETILEKLNIKR